MAVSWGRSQVGFTQAAKGSRLGREAGWGEEEQGGPGMGEQAGKYVGEPAAVAEEGVTGRRRQRPEAGGTGRRQRQAEGLLLTDQPCVTDTG